MNSLRNTINEVKALKANIATLAKEEGCTMREAANLCQSGAALINNDRAIMLIGIAKRGM